MSAPLPVMIRTAKLMKVMTALTLVEDMPASVKTMLRNRARAIRLLTEAGEYESVTLLVTDISGLAADGFGIDGSSVEWPRLVVKHCHAVLAVTKG